MAKEKDDGARMRLTVYMRSGNVLTMNNVVKYNFKHSECGGLTEAEIKWRGEPNLIWGTVRIDQIEAVSVEHYQLGEE